MSAELIQLQASNAEFRRQTAARLMMQAAQSARPDGANESRPAPENERPAPEKDRVELSGLEAHALKFDFFYERVVESSRQAEILQDGRARTLTQNMYNRVTAKFSLDLSFVQEVARQTGRAAAISPDVLEEFTQAATGLTKMDSESFGDFVHAVDDLFNSVETALGLPEDGLDGFADSVKQAAKNFLQDVRTAVEQIDVQQKDAARAFRRQLKQLLRAEKEDREDPLADFKSLLKRLGIRGKEKEDLMRLAKLLLQYAKKHGEKDDPLKPLTNLLKKAARPEPKAEAKAPRAEDEQAERAARPERRPAERGEARAVPSRVVNLYEQTRVQETIAVNVQHASLELTAA